MTEIQAPTDHIPQASTFEEAARNIRDLQAEATRALDRISDEAKNLIVTRYRQGHQAHQATDLPGSEKYGQGIIKALSERSGAGERTLYDARKWYRFLRDEGCETERDLRRWIAEAEEARGKSLTWGYCRRKAAKDDSEPEDPGVQLGRLTDAAEEQAYELDLEAERLQAERAETDAVREARGVASMLREKAADLRREAERGDPGEARIVDAEYLEHLRGMPCAACGTHPSDPHHLATGGTATKGDDCFAVPLCREHHEQLHARGKQRFHAELMMDLWRDALKHFAEYAYGLPPGAIV